MTLSRLFRRILAVAVLLLVSCGSTNANAGRQRAVRTVPANREWARGAVFYEIFVRSFADSDSDGKGDLNGLISKLDYLNDGNPATTTDLGVDAIWLMPIFQSPSYHGYDTTDYETIEKDYGTNADFPALPRVSAQARNPSDPRFRDEPHQLGASVVH